MKDSINLGKALALNQNLRKFELGRCKRSFKAWPICVKIKNVHHIDFTYLNLETRDFDFLLLHLREQKKMKEFDRLRIEKIFGLKNTSYTTDVPQKEGRVHSVNADAMHTNGRKL